MCDSHNPNNENTIKEKYKILPNSNPKIKIMY